MDFDLPQFHQQQQQQQQQHQSDGTLTLDLSAAPTVPPMTVPWLSEVGSLEDLERELIAYASSGDECPNTISPFSISAPTMDWPWLAASLSQDPALLLQHQTALDMSALADLQQQQQQQQQQQMNEQQQQQEEILSDHEQLFLQSSGSSSFGVVPSSGLIFDPRHLMHSSSSAAPSDEDSGHMSDVSVSASAHVSFSASPSSTLFPDLEETGDVEDEEEEEDNGSNGESFTSESRKPFSQPRPFSRKSRGNFLATLTDEERRLLAEEGYEFPEHETLTKEEERRLKSLRRKIKNKISAQDSRKKKKEYMSGLEGRVKMCTAANKQLKTKVETLEAENRSLLDQLREMKESLERLTRGSANKKAGTALMLIGLCFAFFLNPMSMSSGSGVNAGPAASAGFAPSTFKSRTLMSANDGAAAAAAEPSYASSIFGDMMPEWLVEILNTRPGEIPPSLHALSDDMEEVTTSGFARLQDNDNSGAYLGAPLGSGDSGFPTEVPPIIRPSPEDMGSMATDEGEEACDDDEGEDSKKPSHRRAAGLASGARAASAHSLSAEPGSLYAKDVASSELSEKPFKQARLHMPSRAQAERHQSFVSVSA